MIPESSKTTKSKVLNWTAVCLLSAMLLMLISGCGYRFAASTDNRISSDEKIWVSFIANETASPTAQTVIRRALLDQLHIMRGVAPAGSLEQANAVVSGTIRSYSGRVLSYSAVDRDREFRLTIAVELELRRKGDAAPVWKGTLQAFQDYPASDDLALQRNAEEAALVAASQKLAEKFITAVEQSY